VEGALRSALDPGEKPEPAGQIAAPQRSVPNLLDSLSKPKQGKITFLPDTEEPE